MNTFKVGDRVVGYSLGDEDLDLELRETGRVTEVDPGDNTILVKLDRTKDEYWYHYKQCRKLVKKRDKELEDHFLRLFDDFGRYEIEFKLCRACGFDASNNNNISFNLMAKAIAAAIRAGRV